MAIDYGIAYDCPPKRLMGAEGILERVKSRAHAETVIALYREGGDQRPPTEMEFEMTRTNLEGVEESRVINVQGLLDFAAQLNPLARHCEGCPANVTGKPFGCYGAVQYPISAAAERWLLDSLPGIAEPLIWLLLRQGVQELGYDGASVAPLRADPTYFEEHRLPGRDLTEFIFTGNQMFEMLFLVGAIQPSHAGMLLLLLGAIRREIEADQIVRIMTHQLTDDEIARDYPFLLTADRSEFGDATIRQITAFLRALYAAWRLNVPVGLDV